MNKEFSVTFVEPTEPKDIKTWVIETFQKLEGIPITETSRDLILSKYNEFENLLTEKFLAPYIKVCVNYSESEWELHNILIKVVKAFSDALNECSKKLDKELYSIQEYRAKGKILEFDESYEVDDLWEVL